MRALIDEIKKKHESSKPDAAMFYEKTNWLCQISFSSDEPDAPPIEITTNVRIHTVVKQDSTGKETKKDIIFMRDSASNSEVWPYEFFKTMCETKPNIDYLDLAKARPSEQKLTPTVQSTA